MGVAIVCRQEYCFNAREVAVHDCHGCFVLVVNGGAQSLNYRVCTMFPAEIHQKALTHGLNAHTAKSADGLLDHFKAFFGLKAVFFGIVGGHGHNHLVKETAGTGNDLYMTVMDWVKRSGADGSAHTQQSIKAPTMSCLATDPRLIVSCLQFDSGNQDPKTG